MRIQNKSVESLLNDDSNVLYIFFGGIRAGIAMPPFEFYKASGIINENKIFFRDFAQSWYQAGLKDISLDIDTTVTYIKSIINKIRPEKVFFIGNSMGGYAALLFSTFVDQSEAIAFAPQTFISSELRKKYNDRRWPQQISRTLSLSTRKKETLDLRNFFLNQRTNNRISIFVAKDSTLDLIHAYHVKDCPGVNMFEFDAGGHSLVRELRDKGKLPQIMLGEYSHV